jgi:valyl-tRNA synthetase
MPFLTEEIWHALYDGKPPAKSIALTQYPVTDCPAIDSAAVAEMEMVQSLIVAVRALRKEIGVEEKASTPVEVRIDAESQAVVKQNIAIVERLAKVSEVRFVEEISAGLSKHSTASFDVAVIYERTIDVPAERERLTKEIAKLTKGMQAAQSRLGNTGFLAKAPAHIVDGLKKQAAETGMLLAKAQTALDALPKEDL